MALEMRRYVKKYPARAAEQVAIDVGGVLSNKQVEYQDGQTIYRAAMPGAYMFIHMLKHRTGRWPKVVSRVNQPDKCPHWVHRFCVSLGMPQGQVNLVKHMDDKKYFTEGMTCVIDDQWLALKMMACGGQETLIDAIWFHADKKKLPPGQSSLDSWVGGKMTILGTFEELVQHLRLQCPPQVQQIFAEGPPNGPHKPELVQRALALLEPKEVGTTVVQAGGKDDDEVTVAAAQDESVHDVDFDDDMAALPAAAATEAFVAASATESVAASATEFVAASATEKEAVPDQPQGAVAETAAAAAAAGSSNPPSSGLILTERPDHIEKPLDDNDEEDRAAEKMKQRRVFIAAKDDDYEYYSECIYSSDDDAPHAGSAKDIKKRQATTGYPQSADKKKRETKSSREPSPSVGSPRPTRKLGVSLRERPASHADVVSAVHQLRSDMQTVVRHAVWSASSTPTQHPWGSNRSTHSGWAQKKAQRAMQHRAAAGNRPPKVIDLPMCTGCQRNQPGCGCTSHMCRQCCTDPACPQHGG